MHAGANGNGGVLLTRHPGLSGFSWSAHRDYRMLADVLPVPLVPALTRSARLPH